MTCIVVVGRAGSGEGEQSRRLAARLGLEHVSTGELLRAAARDGTAVGDLCSVRLTRGEPVPDDLVAGIVAERVALTKAVGTGVVLDGYPRTVAQATRLLQLLAPAPIDLAIHLDVPRSVAVDRIQHRRVCTACGATGRTVRCEVCNGATERRADDEPAAIGRRMSDHAREVGPLLAWLDQHTRLVSIDGAGPADVVAERIARFGTKVPAGSNEGP